MIDLDAIPHIQARWYRVGRLRPIRLLVVHTPEFPELNDGAERLAQYFASTDRQASVHVTVDADSMVRSVLDTDTAFGAEHANADGLHAELVGYAAQTADEWDDDYSRAVTERAAALFRAWGHRWGIPLRRLTVDEIRAGEAGIAGHADVYQALGGTAVRTDPGHAFPWERFLAALDPAPTLGGGLDVFLYGQHPDQPGVALGLLVAGGVIVCQLQGTPDLFGLPPSAGVWVNGGPGVGAGSVPVRLVQPYVLRWLLDQHARTVSPPAATGGGASPNQVAAIVEDAKAQIVAEVNKRRGGTISIG